MQTEGSNIWKFKLQLLLQLQLFPDMMLLIYNFSMDIRNCTEDKDPKNFKIKVIHSIGSLNIFVNSLTNVVLYKAIQKESLALTAFYTRFKATLCILSIIIENLYLDDAQNPKAIQTNPSAASLTERRVIRSIYYMLLTLHIIGVYMYQQVLKGQMTYQQISLKRYVEGIYVKYWIYLDALVSINFLAATVIHLYNIVYAHREPIGSPCILILDSLAYCLHNIATFLAAYSAFRRNKFTLEISFYIRITAYIVYMMNIAIYGREKDKILRRSVLTRGIIPDIYSKLFYNIIWLPLIRVHNTMTLVCLRQFIDQLQNEETARSNSFPANFLYSESQDFSNGRAWKSKLKTLDEEDKKVIKLCKLNTRFLKIDPSNCLGSGEFGLVYKGHMGFFSKKRDVAIKIARVSIDQHFISCLLLEFRKLLFVGNHENIVKFYGFFRVTTSHFGNLGLVMEYCSHGSLLSYVKRIRHQNLSPEVICNDLNRFAYETAKGLEYLSSKQIVHGDVSCRNVLLSENKTIKITDFGMSLNLYNYQQHATNDEQVCYYPWKWMSPEALTDLKFSIQSDAWSYGVLVFEIFSLGETPYQGLSWTSAFVKGLKMGRRLEQPELASDQIYEIMKNCWEYEPRARITFTNIIETFENLNLVCVVG